jgi:hypothetical protein
MYTMQVSDRETFTSMAATKQQPVTLIVSGTILPVQKQGGVFMTPALTLDYSMEFFDENVGNARWTFREVVLTEDGRADTSGSLWAKLTKADPPAKVRVIDRTGSL